MKKFIPLLILVFFVVATISTGCKPSQTAATVETPCCDTVRDTITIVKIEKVIDHRMVDSLSICLAEARDSISLYRDSIPYQDYINGRRIEKIKYYINLCEKN